LIFDEITDKNKLGLFMAHGVCGWIKFRQLTSGCDVTLSTAALSWICTKLSP